jgi:hypothetical protein
MKLHIYLNEDVSTPWNYFLGVMDAIHKNMKHLWVFLFLLVGHRGESLRNSGRMTWG